MPPKKKPADKPEPEAETESAEVEPVDAAIDEAAGVVKLTFRGADFAIPHERFGSPAFRLGLKILSSGEMTVETGDVMTDFMFGVLGPQDSARFIRLCKPGEMLDTVAAEFFRELNARSGAGNS